MLPKYLTDRIFHVFSSHKIPWSSNVMYVFQKRRSTDSKPLKLWEGRSGSLALCSRPFRADCCFMWSQPWSTDFHIMRREPFTFLSFIDRLVVRSTDYVWFGPSRFGPTKQNVVTFCRSKENYFETIVWSRKRNVHQSGSHKNALKY